MGADDQSCRWWTGAALIGTAAAAVAARAASLEPPPPTSSEQAGRVTVVTNASEGLGFSTAEGLAARGGTVILGCRDAAQCQAAVQRIIQTVGTSNGAAVVCGPELALEDRSSIMQFASAVKDICPVVHGLVHTATTATKHQYAATTTTITPCGQPVDTQLAQNNLGPLALSVALLPRLRSSAIQAATDSRIVHACVQTQIQEDDVSARAQSSAPAAAPQKKKVSAVEHDKRESGSLAAKRREMYGDIEQDAPEVLSQPEMSRSSAVAYASPESASMMAGAAVAGIMTLRGVRGITCNTVVVAEPAPIDTWQRMTNFIYGTAPAKLSAEPVLSLITDPTLEGVSGVSFLSQKPLPAVSADGMPLNKVQSTPQEEAALWWKQSLKALGLQMEAERGLRR